MTGSFLFYFSLKLDQSLRYRILTAYYVIEALLLTKASLTVKSGISNVYIYNLLYLLTVLAMGYYFFSILVSKKKKTITVVAASVTTLYYMFYNVVEVQEYFDSIGYVIASMSIVLFIFLYLHQIFTNITDESLFLNFDFWFICGQLIYHLGAFGIFLTYHQLTKKILQGDHYSFENRVTLTYLWGIHNVLLFLGTLLTCGSILWIAYRKKSL